MLARVIKQVNKNHDINLLINNAGTAYYGLHEELNAAKISRMVRTNLEAPMIICNLLLRDLKKNHGMIINISSVTAQKSNPHGCAFMGQQRRDLQVFHTASLMKQENMG